jgi:Secretion system C-terminal sorting domain
MKSKILLVIFATVAVLSLHAQTQRMFLGNKKIIPKNTTIEPGLSNNSNKVNASQQPSNSSIGFSSPIVIDYTNNLVPVTANDDNVFIFDQQIPVPSEGNNKIYDFGNLTYEPQNFSTNLSVQPPRPNIQGDRTAFEMPGNILDFNGLLVDTTSFVYTTNVQGLFITKVPFTAARTSLESITGVVTDSLIIPEQIVELPSLSHVQEYPIIYGKKWIQDPGISGPLLFISLASEGLDHAPVRLYHAHRFVHNIVGWGKIRVPTANGPSKYFNCLLDKVTGPYTLSLYVNGKPASSAVANIFFGDPNYIQTYNFYQYIFYKKGFWDLGGEAVIDMDPTFTTALDIVFDESYLNIDCANESGVQMCKRGFTTCVPYQNNLANIAMLQFGSTLGNCNTVNQTLSDDGIILGSSPIEEDAINSTTTHLQVFPNPVETSTNIKFSLANSQKVSVQIFDNLGRLVKTLANDYMEAGSHQITWNGLNERGSQVTTGIYFLKFKSEIYSETKKLSLIK